MKIIDQRKGEYSQLPAVEVLKIMFDAFDEYPKDMMQSEVTTTFVLGQILFHEIYHHIRHRNKLRALKYKKEEKEANYWALKETIQILNKLYNKDNLLIFKEEYYRLNGSGRISPPF